LSLLDLQLYHIDLVLSQLDMSIAYSMFYPHSFTLSPSSVLMCQHKLSNGKHQGPF
jgi:hypothetical protein